MYNSLLQKIILSVLCCLTICLIVYYLYSLKTKDRYVTILYSTWADHMMNNGSHPIMFETSCEQGICGSGYHWWGAPAYKNGSLREYRFINDDGSINNDLIDYHADLLYNAGIDFISIDLTNGEQPLIVKSTHAVCKRYSERFGLEMKSPQIVLFVQNENSAKKLKTQFYDNQIYDENIFFNYENNPLILIAFTDKDNSIPEIEGLTCRRCWGLLDFNCIGNSKSVSSAYICSDTDVISWTFKQNTNVNGQKHLPFIRNGKPEQMSVCVATQETFMSDPNTKRIGRNDGYYYNKQWENVMKYDPTFVFITAWNEWGSENQKTPPNYAFVDTYGQEFSSDIEPMFAGHEDKYYILTKEWVKKYKRKWF